MNKQTANIDPKKVARKVRRGHAITVAELSVHIGVSCNVVRRWRWLPKIGKWIFFDDFVIARQRAAGLRADRVQRCAIERMRPVRAKEVISDPRMAAMVDRFYYSPKRGRRARQRSG